MFRSLAIVLVAFFLHSTSGEELYEGDACRVARSGAPGTCKSLANCEAAILELQRGENPAHCGWSGGLEIVCCQNPATAKPKPVRSDRLSARSECQIYPIFAVFNCVTFFFHFSAFRMQRV